MYIYCIYIYTCIYIYISSTTSVCLGCCGQTCDCFSLREEIVGFGRMALVVARNSLLKGVVKNKVDAPVAFVRMWWCAFDFMNVCKIVY